MDYFVGDIKEDEKLRNVNVVRNGHPTKMLQCILQDNWTFEEICKALCDTFGLKPQKKPRIFKQGGVEVFEEDCKYIQKSDILYISKGEDFDESSNFALYKMKDLLGEGGFGKVFMAKNRLNKEKVAIKLIDRNKMKTTQETEMLFKEIMALKNLQHKNIVKIINCYFLREDNNVAIVLEFLEGGDLRKYIREHGSLDEEECQFLFRQLHDAMQYCHRQKVIHRDLKLENIMFLNKDFKNLKVVDFGISGVDQKINIDYTTAGSCRYLAPEVITSHAPAHPGIDIWAMGCILYWMIVGQPPFDAMTKQEIQDKILKGNFTFPSEIKKKTTKSCQDLIHRMLCIDYKERITMSDISTHEWMNHSINQIQENENMRELENKRIKEEEEEKRNAQQKLNKTSKVPFYKRLTYPSKDGSNIIPKDGLSQNQQVNFRERTGSVDRMGQEDKNQQKNSQTQPSKSRFNQKNQLLIPNSINEIGKDTRDRGKSADTQSQQNVQTVQNKGTSNIIKKNEGKQ